MPQHDGIIVSLLLISRPIFPLQSFDLIKSVDVYSRPNTKFQFLLFANLRLNGTGSTRFPLLGFDSNGAIVAQVLQTNNTIVTATGPILIVSSSWIPIVQTWSSTNGLRLYVNNTLVSSIAASSFLGSQTTPNYLTLGNCLNGCGVCSSGSIGVMHIINLFI